MSVADVHVGVLGHAVLSVDGAPLPVTARRPRALLSVLALHRGRPVRRDAIVDALWGEAPPPGVHNTLQGYVADLRRLLEPGRARGEAPTVLRTAGDGYLLDVPAEGVDLSRFELLSREASRTLGAPPEPLGLLAGDPSGDADRALVLIDEALSLWRGDALLDLGEADVAVQERQRLAVLRLEARIARSVATLALGRATVAVPDLEGLRREQPWDERVAGLLAVGLARTGRQADALAVLRTLRAAMVAELGLEPGRATRDLETAIARQQHDPATPSVRRPVAACRADRWPLVGRERELAVLDRALAGVRDGMPEVVHLSGEHGVGRSRLCRELARRAAEQGVAAVRLDAGGDLPVALSSSLEGRDAVEPLVLVVEDVDRADEAGRATLGDLVERLALEPDPPPVLLVITRATGPAPDAGLELRLARAHALRLTVEGLDRDESEALVRSVTGRASPSYVVDAMQRRAGGNPFLLVELAREQVVGGDPDAVPASVRAVVTHHLTPLVGPARSLLRCAAAAGPGLDPARLGELAGADLADVHDALDLGVAAGVLVEEGPDRYGFRQEVVREVLEHELPARDRAVWRSHGVAAATPRLVLVRDRHPRALG